MKRGPGVRKGRKLGPMRKVTRILRFPHGIFDTYFLLLECGHEAHGWSSNRVHCRQCLSLEDAKAADSRHTL